MKICVGNWRFSHVGGSENYAITLAEELERQGHEVDTMTATDAHMVHGDYGGVFLSQNVTVEKFFETLPDFDPSKVVQTIHGLVPSIERPSNRPIKLVAISEEIQAIYPECKVIHQGIDLNEFSPIRELPEKPKRLFSLSQSDAFNDLLYYVCQDSGLEFSYRNKDTNPEVGISQYLQSADIVVSIGRGVYEAMACGCEVIVADWRGYNGKLSDGIIWTEDGYRDIMAYNCSGRRYKLTADRTFIEEEISLYSNEFGANNRKLVKKYNDIKKVAQEYLELIR